MSTHLKDFKFETVGSKLKKAIVYIFCLFLSEHSISAQTLLQTDITAAIYQTIKVPNIDMEILYRPLTVITFDRLIEAKALKNALVYTAESFIHCGIRFNIHHIHKFKPGAAGMFDPFSDSAQAMMENWLTDLPPNMSKPILIYVPLKSALGTLKAVSLPEQKQGIDTGAPSHLVNVAWINSNHVSSARWETIVDRISDFRSIYYTTEAHELGHILLRSGHVDGELFGSNIMANGDAFFVGSRFSREQCNFMRSNPILR